MIIELLVGVAIGYIPCMFFILSYSLHLLILEFPVVDNFGFCIFFFLLNDF